MFVLASQFLVFLLQPGVLIHHLISIILLLAFSSLRLEEIFIGCFQVLELIYKDSDLCIRQGLFFLPKRWESLATLLVLSPITLWVPSIRIIIESWGWPRDWDISSSTMRGSYHYQILPGVWAKSRVVLRAFRLFVARGSMGFLAHKVSVWIVNMDKLLNVLLLTHS